MVAGFTARRRAAKRDLTNPKVASVELLDFARNGPVAVLFGREDKGLPNEILDRAHIVVTIPTTEHASLNLAQAVLIALYELHLSAADSTRTLAPPRKDAPPATAEEYEQLFADAERGLYAIDFFKTRFHEHIMRSVRTLIYRAAPDSRELALLASAVSALCLACSLTNEEERHEEERSEEEAQGGLDRDTQQCCHCLWLLA